MQQFYHNNNRPKEIQCFELTAKDYIHRPQQVSIEPKRAYKKITKRTLKNVISDYIEENIADVIGMAIFCSSAGIAFALGILYFCSRL